MAYCTTSDVESIMSQHGVTAFVDDDESGIRDATETGFIADAIDRAAAFKIDVHLDERYPDKTGWASNSFIKWANAIYAAVEVSRRRLLEVPSALAAQAKELDDTIDGIRRGILRIPGAANQFHSGPMVSNYDVERYRVSPVRVDQHTSTGPAPDVGIKRKVASVNHGVD